MSTEFIDELLKPNPELEKACAEIVRAYAKRKAQEFGITIIISQPTRKIDIEFHDEIVWGNLAVMEAADKIIASRKIKT